MMIFPIRIELVLDAAVQRSHDADARISANLIVLAGQGGLLHDAE
jgi:hypothetical protein